MIKKYLLMPGNIVSEFSGDLIWVSALQLSKKYKVDMKECLVYNNKMMNIPEDIIILKPQENNKYINYKKD